MLLLQLRVLYHEMCYTVKFQLIFVQSVVCAHGMVVGHKSSSTFLSWN